MTLFLNCNTFPNKFYDVCCSCRLNRIPASNAKPSMNFTCECLHSLTLDWLNRVSEHLCRSCALGMVHIEFACQLISVQRGVDVLHAHDACTLLNAVCHWSWCGKLQRLCPLVLDWEQPWRWGRCAALHYSSTGSRTRYVNCISQTTSGSARPSGYWSLVRYVFISTCYFASLWCKYCNASFRWEVHVVFNIWRSSQLSHHVWSRARLI